MNITFASEIGLRPYQEDRLVVHHFNSGTLLVVLDGHNGSECAEICANELPILWKSSQKCDETFIRAAIANLDGQTKRFASGCTLSLAFIPKDTRTAHIAVIGDSPVIVHTKDGIDISPEHNVRTNLAERQAAISRGGFYQRGYICDRVSHKGLQLSRALGGCLIRPAVSSEPEIYTREIQDWILLASDGLFDPTHNGSALCAENFKLFADLNAQQMVDTAIARNTGDNATAIMVRF